MPPRRPPDLIAAVQSLISGRSDKDLFVIMDVVRNEIKQRGEDKRTKQSARTKAEIALKRAMKCRSDEQVEAAKMMDRV